jgi:RNA polymerase sigma-70 factor (ECF subfamily)
VLIIEQAFGELGAKLEAEDKQRMFDELKPFLRGGEPRSAYSIVAQRLGMSEGAVKVAVHRLRRDYKAILRARIAQTVASPEELEMEIRELFSAVRQ